MPQPNRTFRIFVSSTFNDLKEERNALQRYVFPRLRELCLQYGCRFQAIDLRWGVREEAALDHQAMKICLEEIKRCQKTTPRPNFIVLLGDRYGWMPVPAEIPADEFEELERYLTDNADRDFLHAWYKRDENAISWEGKSVEGIFILQARGTVYKDLGRWDVVERRLRKILGFASEKANFSEKQRYKYTTSATEQEIYSGALSPELSDAEEHIFCFFRNITNLEVLENDLEKSQFDTDSPAANYVDLFTDCGKWCLDLEAKQHLTSLKETKLTSKLPQNIHRYSAVWKDSKITLDHIGRLPPNLKECLLLNKIHNPPLNLCVDVWRRLSTVILDEINTLKEKNSVEQEIDVHQAFGEDRAEIFIGRRPYLQAIGKYINGSNQQPFVITGEPGSGKSALMAKAIDYATKEHQGAVCVSRFIGATPTSSDGRAILESLCRQISQSYTVNQENIPSGYRELVTAFQKCLSLARAEKPLLILLDALDQLTNNDNARSLNWIPAELPEYVRFVVSTLPGQSLSILESKNPEANRLTLKPMKPVEGSDLLAAWLHDAGRTLQNDQRKEVLSNFEKSGLPLYLKLVFEEAKLWKSYSQRVQLSQNISDVIGDLFKRLCANENHGEIMVARSLGYLAAAKNGLTEDEMLDVLSKDGDVIDDFTERAQHTPPEPRLPAIIWSRLFFDIEPYLMERTADGTNLMTFYHNQFAEVVYAEYLHDDIKKKRHKSLAQYFDKQLLWIEYGEEKHSNIRKVSELPYQQIHGEMWDDLEQTLCDLHFIESKCMASMTYELIADYNSALNALAEAKIENNKALKQNDHIKKYTNDLIAHAKGKSKEIRIPESVKPWSSERIRNEIDTTINNPSPSNRIMAFSQFVKSESHGLVNFCLLPGFCLQQAFNYTSSGPVHAVVKKVMRDSKSANIFLFKKELHRLPFNPYPEQVKMFTGHSSWVRAVIISLDGKKALSGSSDGTIRVWDLESGEYLKVKTDKGLGNGIDCVNCTPDFKLALAGGWNSILYVWNLESEECPIKLKGHTDWITCLSITPDGKKAVSGSRDRTLRLWDPVGQKCIAKLEGHTTPIYGVSITPDGKLAVSASTDKTLRLWDLEKKICIGKLEGHEKSVYSISITPDGKMGVSGSSDKTIRVWDLVNKECIATLKGHRGLVRNTCITPDGKWALSGGWDGTVRLWDIEKNKCLRKFEGHADLVEAVSISADGRTAISGGADNTMRVWNLENGASYGKIDGHTASIEGIAISTDGSKIISASRDWTLRVWDMADRYFPRILGKHNNIVKSVCVSSDSRIAVSTGWDRSLKVWDLESEKLLRILDGEPDKHGSIHISLDGRRVWDRTLREWDLETGKCIREKQERPIDTEVLCTTPDERLIVFGSLDKTIKVLDVEKRECIRTFERKSGDITCIKVTTDGTRVVSGSKDRKLYVWDFKKGFCIHQLTGHTEGISCLSISQDSKHAVSGSWDKSLRVWDLQTGKNIAVLPTNSEVTAISDIRDWGHFACGTHSGEVILLTLSDLQTIDITPTWIMSPKMRKMEALPTTAKVTIDLGNIFK